MSEKAQRHQQIVDLIARNTIESQEQLQDLLSAEGVECTQATLSRDLRELGYIKSEGGYSALADDGRGVDELTGIAREFGERIRSVNIGDNVVVLRTDDAKTARNVSRRFDDAKLHHVAGTMAAGDKILVVAISATTARALARYFER